MARRRSGRVPFAEWVKAFAIYNTAVAKAYDDWAAQTPERLPRAFGAVYRIVMAKIALPRLHMLLRKGAPLDEAVRTAIEQAIVEVTKRPQLVELVLKRLGIEGNVDTYVKLIKEAAKYLAENLASYLTEAEAKYGVQTPMEEQAAPQAQPITVPA